MQIEDSYNPSIHRINHAIKQRAVCPEADVPEIQPVLLRFSSPPEDLIAKVQERIDALVEAAEVKKGKLPRPPAAEHRLTTVKSLRRRRAGGARKRSSPSPVSTLTLSLVKRRRARFQPTMPFLTSSMHLKLPNLRRLSKTLRNKWAISSAIL